MPNDISLDCDKFTCQKRREPLKSSDMSFGTIPPHHPNPKPALAIRLMSWNQVNQLPEVVSRVFFNPHQSLEFGADKFIRTNLLYISRLYIRKTLASPKVSNGTLRSVEVSNGTRLGYKYTNVPWAKAVYVPRAINRCFFTSGQGPLGKKTTVYCPRYINGVFARGTLYINIYTSIYTLPHLSTTITQGC